MVSPSTRCVMALACATALLAATGCGGGSSDSTVTTSSCEQLKTLQIPPSAIGMPTTGATVTAANVVTPASGSAATAYCLVAGDIKPVDKTAPAIQFNVALPVTWNQKALMLGGGGSNGTIPDVTANPGAPPTTPSPLARGYAVLAGDSGHQNATGVDPYAFALNDEALANYNGDALKKTRDVAVAIMRAHYGKGPSKSYFLGGSTGGREGLTAAARWPDDWDGVVSMYPAIEGATTRLAYLAMAQAFTKPGGYVNQAKRLVLRQAALQACDGLDGVADGVISNVPRCNATFHPATATLAGNPIRCAGGADTGDTCLSDAQLASIDRMNSPFAVPYPMAGGSSSYPGLNANFSDLGVPGTSQIQSLMTLLSPLGAVPPASPFTPLMGVAGTAVDGVIRYFIAKDAAFNSLSMDPLDPGPYQQAWSDMSASEAVVYELDAFRKRGGKLLLMHGTEDVIVSTRNTENFYARLQGRLGAAAVDGFTRFYLIPGFGHSVSSTFMAAWDSLAALDGWAAGNQDPRTHQTVVDLVGVPGRTRPLCHYPAWPRYGGSGDVNLAASFTCATN